MGEGGGERKRGGGGGRGVETRGRERTGREKNGCWGMVTCAAGTPTAHGHGRGGAFPLVQAEALTTRRRKRYSARVGNIVVVQKPAVEVRVRGRGA